MELLSFFKHRVHLSDEMELAIDNMFVRQEVEKGEKLLLPDNLSKRIFFLEKGLLRNYYLKDLKDITQYFFEENSFALPIESIFYQERSPYGLEALERSTVRVGDYARIENYMTEFKELEQLARYLLIDSVKTFSERLLALQFQTAHERYKSMMDKYPDILLRAPLGHIASYLGITQQTLSVIRAQK